MNGPGEDHALMRIAVEVAREGIGRGQTPFGACVAREGRVVARDHNHVWGTTDATAHAEVLVVRRACRELATVDLSGCDIFTTCEPCPMCFTACHWARLDRIVYGAGIGDARDAGFRELEIPAREMKRRGGSPVRLRGGVEREACVELFREWSARPDSRAY